MTSGSGRPAPGPPADGAASEPPADGAAPESTTPIDEAAVTAWIAERVDVDPPLSFDLIPGGRSNMTFAVADAAGRRLVLRRPPLGKLLASAHDMAREHRLMAALADTPVPVPRMIGLCRDESVNGRDFYVMDHVDGVVVRDVDIGAGVAPSVRRAMSESLVDTLCALHRVDIDAVGLGGLARRSGYVERQVKRWSGQWEQSKTRELPVIEAVAKMLTERMPEPNPTTIAHGDYRLSNCIMTPAGQVAAVLDWELCTLGEPIADLGQLLGYWHDPADVGGADITGDPETTSLDGFLTQDEMAQRYADRMGTDLEQVTYYRAFAQWRLACIGEGVYARYLAGQQGSQDEEIDLEQMRDGVARRASVAAELLGMT
ncbi:MAG TPA: phosphotransferase family protein [Acidimicrobiaceae bacterium]|nr:phosphotransferase family protein [Acidimicrobiaceae bacterium]HCB37079.1 phosphotransferase family protein [Acidimicrobiaceae bacterium]